MKIPAKPSFALTADVDRQALEILMTAGLSVSDAYRQCARLVAGAIKRSWDGQHVPEGTMPNAFQIQAWLLTCSDEDLSD